MAVGIVNILKEFLFGPPAAPAEKICPNCEMLQEQLAFANYDRKMLLEHFVRAVTPKDEDPTMRIEVDELQPISLGKGPTIPWRVKQQQLQNDSKVRASMLKPTARPDAPREVTRESIEKLEKELGVSDALHE